MLDIQFIRENPEIVKEACRNKQLEDWVVDRLLEVDQKRRELIGKVENLRRQSNENADAIKAEVSKGGKPSGELVKKGKEIKLKLKELEPKLSSVEEEFENLQLQIPNVPSKETPIGPDESGNLVVRTEGKPRQLDFEPKSHQELMENLDLLDSKRAVRIGGFRAYMLKNQAVILEQALMSYAIDLLLKDGFTMLTVPNMVNEAAMIGTGYFPWGNEDHYKIEKDNLILTGTSEVALTAFHAGETLTEKDLPVKLAGISTCYRREVGSYGQDTKGIVRVHQFQKVEQVVLTVADETQTISWHETILGNSEQLLQSLGLSYQVLLMCTGDMGAGQRKKYDIETWFPSQKKYRETHSCSYFNDFQARRLNMRYQAKDGSLKYVYTMNNTMAASPRLLAAIIENYQEPDGSIVVPEVLRPYTGFERIEAVK